MTRDSTIFESTRQQGVITRQNNSAADRDRFFEHIHADLSVEATAYAIVNDGRRLLQCDRVAVLEAGPSKSRLLAVSGVEFVDRRGAVAQTLERLAHVVGEGQEPLYYSGDSSSLAPQLEHALDEYLNQSHVRRLAVVPLIDRSRAQKDNAAVNSYGVLVAEDFQLTTEDEQLWAGLADIRAQVTLALGNALALRQLPLMPLSRLLLSVAQAVRRPRTIIALAVLSLFIAAIFLVQTDLVVRAQGRLLPAKRREVFAPADALVESVLVAHGDTVSEGDALVQLRSSELELELSRLRGELTTARQRLQTARVRRWDRSTTQDVATREGQWAAQEQQLEQQLMGLEVQQRLLAVEEAQLLITAPISGRVLTWNTSLLLADRPIRRGQRLLTLADPSSEWMAEVSVRDRDVGQVLKAQEQLGPELPVTFLTATDARFSGRGCVQNVAIASQRDSDGRPGLQVNIQIDRDGLHAPRSGAEVAAKIHCGKRSIGYVCFHQFFMALRRHLFF